MKRQGQTTPYAVRVKISELANEGQTDAQIAIELGDNYWTVRKWRRRFQQQGKAGLVSTMGRSVKGALSPFSAQSVQSFVALEQPIPVGGLTRF